MVRSHFASAHKNDYPFISIKRNKGEEHYFSSIKRIDNLRFNSEQEVIMANAIFENTKDNFNINEFIQQLKFTFRILGVANEWV